MKLGDSFLGGGEVHGAHHLWLVINDPSAHAGVALIVNVSTLRPDAETTCLVHRGEHPFIRHDSYARYLGARSANAGDLDRLVKIGRLKPHQAASEMLLEKLRAGAKASPHLAEELRALL
jgi:hypothetical protein